MLEIFGHLLPRTPTWSLTHGTRLRRLFEALAAPLEEVREASEASCLDAFVAHTRQLELFERDLGLQPREAADDAERRLEIQASVQASSGDMQATLRAAGYPITVHAFTGLDFVFGFQNGQELRSPHVHLRHTSIGVAHCGGQTWAGQEGAECAGAVTRGFPYLVNLPEPPEGHPELPREVLDPRATDEVKNLGPPTTSAYFIWLGGETFPEPATLQAVRRRSFEARVQRLKPAHMWVGTLVNWV